MIPRAALALLVLLTGCGAAADQPKPVTERPPAIVAVSAEGAVVADNRARAFYGLDRSGKELWRDHAAYAGGGDVICQARCPDPVFSGSAEAADPEPRSLSGVFAPSDARVKRVLTARDASDAVIVESDGAEEGSLRLIRPSGKDVRIPLNGAFSWAEDASRTTAVATSGKQALWFRHDRRGWREVTRDTLAEPVKSLCASGTTAVVKGERAYMLTGSDKPVPITTSLPVVAGCAAGTQGLVVYAYWRDGGNRRFTGISGVDSLGRQTWSREIADEAWIRAHPSGTTFVITYGGATEVIDPVGRTVARHSGTASAAYTADGELALLTTEGKLRWPAH
ncbi:hypothetical protein [Nonomuraea glycinis]|uniref:hypothetical protein n=1 Tax=Nonomuraea glycinis TaxID=2047744 RepID=UPI002E1066B9|nr:hypothetical protein OHA68_13775 [Nonomuraea glycinis]